MRADELLALLRLTPFYPLRLHLSNGRTFDIPHPELAHVGRGIVFVFFRGPNQDERAFERYETISLLHINHVERLHPADPAPSNGEAGA